MEATGERNGFTLRYLLNQYPIQSRIMRDLDMRSILSLCRTSSGLRADIYDDLWDINKKLERFFQNPRAFRTELGRADALISGSFALQFFANKFWPESDLDINLRDGEGVESLGRYLVEVEGYELSRNQDLEHRDYELARLKDLNRIITYTKSSDSGTSFAPPEIRKVQLVATKNHPVKAILGTYYTSCIMNFISWNKAFCIFPRATLLFGETVALTRWNDYDVELHKKYSRRGWRQRSRPVTLAEGAKKYAPRDVFPLGGLGRDRRIGGSDTWTMNLSTAGVARPSQPDSVLEYSSFFIDSFFLDEEEMNVVRVHLEVFKSPSLRYQYTYGDLRPFWVRVGNMLTENTRVQLLTKMTQSEAEPIASLPRLYEAEFEKPDGWDFWDDWIPETYKWLEGIECP
ncbi:hypothetical protein F5Y09DRAFT_348133 [Xylaria sp. FL1042]|nr:hypothetical protein F5Y09DRAFT_348133 [Xylaria sp. FL1042]